MAAQTIMDEPPCFRVEKHAHRVEKHAHRDGSLSDNGKNRKGHPD